MQPYNVAEAYQIYSLLLPQEESYGFAKGTLVIQEETISTSPLSAENCLPPEETNKFKDAIAEYKQLQGKKWSLKRSFQIEKTYEIVSSNTIRLLLKKRAVYHQGDPFYKRYPGSGGFIVMSPVGFDKQKTLAVVYTGSSCGSLCGLWRFHLLEKVDGRWKEVPGAGDACVTMS